MIGERARTEGESATSNGSAASEPGDLGPLLLDLASRVGGGIGELRILGSARSDRLRLRVRRALDRAEGGFSLWIASTALLLAGVVVLAIGVEGAFVALFADRPWLGRIAAGAGLLAAAGAARAARRAIAERALATRLEKKYAEMEPRSRSSNATS